MGKKWIPLESNPEVFNEFSAKIGAPVEEYAFCDVYGMDDELLQMVPQPAKAVLLLFPITEETEKARHEEEAKLKDSAQEISSKLWFTKQTISNACGTVGMLHAFANADVQFKSGSFLEEFMEASAELDPLERANLLENPKEGQPDVEKVHQEAGKEGQTAPPPDEEQVLLHFVCFAEKEGCLYELDGRKFGAINHGPTTPETLLKDSCAVVKKMMESTTNIRFNLMALAPAATS